MEPPLWGVQCPVLFKCQGVRERQLPAACGRPVTGTGSYVHHQWYCNSNPKRINPPLPERVMLGTRRGRGFLKRFDYSVGPAAFLRTFGPCKATGGKGSGHRKRAKLAWARTTEGRPGRGAVTERIPSSTAPRCPPLLPCCLAPLLPSHRVLCPQIGQAPHSGLSSSPQPGQESLPRAAGPPESPAAAFNAFSASRAYCPASP